MMQSISQQDSTSFPTRENATRKDACWNKTKLLVFQETSRTLESLVWNSNLIPCYLPLQITDLDICWSAQTSSYNRPNTQRCDEVSAALCSWLRNHSWENPAGSVALRKCCCPQCMLQFSKL